MKNYRLLITPLSPLHLGTGESYEPTHYVIEDRILHEFDTSAIVQTMTRADRAELLAIASRKPDTGMIQALQRFFHERRSALMGCAIHRIPVLPGVATLYAQRIGKTANQEANGQKVVNRLEIDRTSFNPITRMPVLFGSALKGALRTALLDQVNGGKPAREIQGLHEFQGRLFKYRDPQNNKLKLELDPMRLIQLADAYWSAEPGLPSSQVYLAVNRKKTEVKDKQGHLRPSQAESQKLYQILECVTPGCYRAFSGQLTVQSVANIPSQHRDQLPAANLHFDMATIAQACNRFYQPILEAEIALMQARNYLNPAWSKTIQRFLAAHQPRIQRGDCFLLRVGRHCGAESITLNGVRKIKIIQGKGQPSDHLNAAKTLWLAANQADQTQNLLPFGWVLVEVHPLTEATAAAWPELQAACEPLLADARAFAAQLQAKEAELEQARHAAVQKRQEEAEKARQQAEQAARDAIAQQQRAAHLATLSDNLKAVEAFKSELANRIEQLRGKKDRPNTPYHQKAQQLAKQAREGTNWTAAEKIAVADAITEWLPKVIEGMDKSALKKLNLAALRE